MRHRLLVISLKRTPERLESLLQNQQRRLVDWDVDVIHGIDGEEQEQINQQSRWVSTSKSTGPKEPSARP